MNMQISELMMSSPHNFPCILFTEMMKIPDFSYEKVKTCLMSTLNKCRIMFALIYMQKEEDNFQKFIYKIHGKLRGDEIINSLICIFISTVQVMFHLKLRFFFFFFSSFFSHFKSELHQIFTVLFEMFYSFY